MNPNPFGNLIHPAAVVSAVMSFFGVVLFLVGMVLVETGHYTRELGIPLSVVMLVCGLVGLLTGLYAVRRVLNGQFRTGGKVAAAWGTGFSVLVLVGFGISTQFPMMKLKKSNEHRVICAGNLEALHHALMLYASNNDGRLPDQSEWCGAVLGVTDQLVASGKWDGTFFQCPGAATLERCSYGFNTHLSGMRTNDISDDAILIFEVDGGWNFYDDPMMVRMKPRHLGNLHVTMGGEVLSEPSM